MEDIFCASCRLIKELSFMILSVLQLGKEAFAD
jgi:hypothetical protein